MSALQIVEHKNQRVLTTQQLAEGYGAESASIVKNFNRNRERYIEGIHFYCLTGDVLRAFRAKGQIGMLPENLNKLYLWTERGAFLHAKSLGTDKAWEVYQHLIETYFRARAMFNVPQTMSEALFLAARLQKEIEENRPLVAFAQTAAQSEDSILIRELAKICCKNGVEIGQNRLFKRLREWGMLFPKSTEPYQEYVDRGYFEVVEGTHENSGGIGLHKTTRVLPKGQQYIMQRLREERRIAL